MDNSVVRKTLSRWLAPVAVVLGLICIVAGFGLLTWTPGVASTARSGTASVVPSTVEATNTATVAPLPTLALMVTSAPTASPSPTAPQAASLAEAGATFTLTIVHSNDTWGYTRPCG